MSFINFKRHIVPQSIFLVALIYSPFLLAQATIPPMPENVEQARELVGKIEGLKVQENYKLDLKQRDCYDTTLISNCLRNVRDERNKMQRGFRQVENHARDLIRDDDFEQKRLAKDQAAVKEQEQAPEKEATQNEKAAKYKKRQEESDLRLAPTPNMRSPKQASEPSRPSLEEQSQNREAFEEKQKTAQQRRQEKEKQLKELQLQREKFRQEQEKNYGSK